MVPPRSRMNKMTLSKNLLEMKFMKKTKEKAEHLKEDADRQTMFSHEITSGMLHEGPKFVEEASLVPLLGLVEGRFSFRGMNPEVERLMAAEEEESLEAERLIKQERDEKCVQDDEMANSMGPLAGSLSRKFANKKPKGSHKHSKGYGGPEEDVRLPRKKAKFMKPELDY